MIKPILDASEWVWERTRKRSQRIVVVEDNPVDAKLLVECLASSSINRAATVAETSEAALALIQRNKIAIIFVDMRLKYMHGWELIPLVQRKSPHTFIVVTCGLLEDLVNIKSESWSFHVMPKPVSVGKLERLFDMIKL